MTDWESHFKKITQREKGAAFGADFGVDSSTLARVQAKINSLGYSPPLTVDGVDGPKTQAGVKWYQSNHGLTVDGVVGPQTLTSMGLTSTTTVKTPSSPSKGQVTIAHVRGIDKLNADDLKALVAAAQWIGINPDWLASAISFESGFSPSIENAAGSGAVGLIQFMPSTARALGTSTDELKKMTFVQQLEYVKKYFAPHQGKLQSLEDTYLAIFYPAFIGKPNDAILGYAGSAIYDQNAGFDKTKKGYVTKEDITSTIRGVLASAIGRIPVPGLVGIAVVAGGIMTWLIGGALFIAGYFGYQALKGHHG